VPTDFSDLDQFEEDAGKHVAIVHWYQDWSSEAPLNLTAIRTVEARGSISMITWEPWDYTKGLNQPEYRLENIASGNFDDYIRSWAQGLADYHSPVMLRFAHEMNGWWAPWCVGQQGNTAEDYIAAWHHIHDIFQQEGATNVQWVWSPNIEQEGETPFEEAFPGDDYVDWVALDGYNDLSSGTWLTFDELFGSSYVRISQLSAKPVMIAEVASSEGQGAADKAAWITDTYTQAIPARSRIKAVVWFNQNKERDWRVSSSPQAQQAFWEGIKAFYYQGCYFCLPSNQYMPFMLNAVAKP
jgi:beta-mannanase